MKVIKKIVELINEQRKQLIVIFCLIEIFTMGLLFTKVEVNFKLSYNFFINLSLIIVCLFIFFVFFFEKLRYQRLTGEYNYLLNYVKTIESFMEKDRIKNHENKNQLIVIKSLVSKKNKKLIEYIDNILSETINLENDWIAKLKNIPTGGLQGLIYYKIAQMKNANINLSLDISKTLNKEYFLKLDTKEYKDLCTIIGVYLDNAIEAAESCSNKQIGLEIFGDNNNIHIVISNTFTGILNIDKFDASGYSTKGIMRGHGLSLVKSIIEKNNHFSQQREIINDYYVQHLNIKLNID